MLNRPRGLWEWGNRKCTYWLISVETGCHGPLLKSARSTNRPVKVILRYYLKKKTYKIGHKEFSIVKSYIGFFLIFSYRCLYLHKEFLYRFPDSFMKVFITNLQRQTIKGLRTWYLRPLFEVFTDKDQEFDIKFSNLQ